MDRRTYLDFPIFGITISLIGPLALSCVDRSWIVRDFHFRFMGDLLRETTRILRSFLTLPFPPSYYSRERWSTRGRGSWRWSLYDDYAFRDFV